MLILCSKFDVGFKNIKLYLKNKITSNMKVSILPWAFPVEINSDKLLNDYFKKGSERYNRYVDNLKLLGLKGENIFILNCYEKNKNKLNKLIDESNIILLTGGNPEMLYSKLKLIDYNKFKDKSKIIIGESAGALVLFNDYFITKENNFYKKLDFYKGLNILSSKFYIDVHTTNKKEYKDELEEIFKERKKKIYGIHNEGMLVIKNNWNKEIFGEVDIIDN